MRITDEQLVVASNSTITEWLEIDNLCGDIILDLQEARAKIVNLEASLTIKDYLIAELEMQVQSLKYTNGGTSQYSKDDYHNYKKETT